MWLNVSENRSQMNEISKRIVRIVLSHSIRFFFQLKESVSELLVRE